MKIEGKEYFTESEISLMNKRISGIYQILNTGNGRSYVGQSKDIIPRLRSHIRNLRKQKHHNIPLQRAYRKYSELFRYCVLQECDLGDLNDCERFWIGECRSTKRAYGYNLTEGGQDCWKYPARIKKRIHDLAVARCGEKNPMYGKHHTDEAKEKIGAASLSRDPIVYKKIGAAQVGRIHSQERRSAISAALLKKSGGTVTSSTSDKVATQKHNIPVYCFELDRAFYSGMDAERQTGIDHSRISACCKNLKDSTFGLHWSYLRNVACGVDCDVINRFLNPKTVLCVELNRYFSSIEDAASFIGVSTNTITGCCNGNCKTTGGFHWKMIPISERFI